MKQQMTYRGVRHKRRVLRITTACEHVMKLGKELDTESHFREFTLPRSIKPSEIGKVFEHALMCCRRLVREPRAIMPIAFQIFDACDTRLNNRDAEGKHVFMERQRTPVGAQHFFNCMRCLGRPRDGWGSVKILSPDAAQELYQWLVSMSELSEKRRAQHHITREFRRREVCFEAFFRLQKLLNGSSGNPIFTTEILKIGTSNFLPHAGNVHFISWQKPAKATTAT